MTNPNIQLTYAATAAYAEQDEERLRELMHPDGETYGAPEIVNSGTHYGFDGFMRWIRQWEEAWEEIRYELGEFVEVDESLLVAPVHVIGRGAGSGVRIDSVFGWLYGWRDGRLARFHVYASLEDALETARGLAGKRA